MATVKETLAPDSARVVVSYNHVGRRMLSPEVVKEAMTVFVLYVVTYAVGALVGIAHGYDATQSIFESVAMASNGGMLVGAYARQGMPASLELFYMLEMWAGRLEFLTLIALIVEVVVTLDPRRVVQEQAGEALMMRTRNGRRGVGLCAGAPCAVACPQAAFADEPRRDGDNAVNVTAAARQLVHLRHVHHGPEHG